MSRTVPDFSTFGCRLNSYETEVMKTLAKRSGLDDAIVINTCAVTAEAVRKARQEVRSAVKASADRPVVVTGCAAQTSPQLFSGIEGVDHVIGNAEKVSAAVWDSLAREGKRESAVVRVGNIMEARKAGAPLIDGYENRSRAHVQIQNGCDHRCTFCIIPYGRGNSRSVAATEVVAQVRKLVENGYNEVVLTGVDLTSWGQDLPEQPRLGSLVRRVLRELPELPRLRISSIDSIEVDDDLLDAIANEPRLMPHLHLSLQAGDDLILKRMKRRHLRNDAIRFCDEVRRLRPDIVFGADLIAGFPTETEGMFEQSLRLVEECGLTWLHVFPYSARPGTPAARMPQVPGDVVRERAARLRQVGQERVKAFLESQAGQRLSVLVEGPRLGRSEQFAEVELSRDRAIGSVATVAVKGRRGGRLAEAA